MAMLGLEWAAMGAIVAVQFVPMIRVCLDPADYPYLGLVGARCTGDDCVLSFVAAASLLLSHEYEPSYGVLLFFVPPAVATAGVFGFVRRRTIAALAVGITSIEVLLALFTVPYDWGWPHDFAAFLGIQAGIPEEQFRTHAWAVAALAVGWLVLTWGPRVGSRLA